MLTDITPVPLLTNEGIQETVGVENCRWCAGVQTTLYVKRKFTFCLLFSYITYVEYRPRADDKRVVNIQSRACKLLINRLHLAFRQEYRSAINERSG